MARHVPHTTNPLLKVRLPAYRSHLVMLLLALAFVSLAARAAYLQVFNLEFLQKQGEMRYERNIELPASRGKIVDRQGGVLASSLPARGIWAIPEQVDLTASQSAQLARLLEIPERDLKKKLADDELPFVYLKRQVEPERAERIAALALPGIHQRKEYKRHYPEGETVAHVIGFTNVEEKGQEGIERSQENTLAGRSGSRRVIKDGKGRIIEDVQAVQEPFDGAEIKLSIDSKLQYLAFAAVRDAVREHKAKAGAAVVLDVRTGEVLALSSWPTFNPNQRSQLSTTGKLSGEQLRNRVTNDAFEPGSTMKPFTAALAMELGKVGPRTVIDTAPGYIQIGKHKINDAHRHGPLTVEQIIQKSSNVGTVKMALQMPAQKMWEMLSAAGFGQAPQVGMPGSVAGRLRSHKTWKTVEQATISYGHGVSVSLMQIARAYTAFARNGDVVPISMIKSDTPAVGVPLFKPETALAVRKMLEMATGPDGTAPRAQVPGYRVAGKTGTAHKPENGVYTNKYVSSFVGFAPVSDPRIVIAVMIDEPAAGKYYAGDVAAPVFSRIAGDGLRALRVVPDLPVANLVIPVNPVKESL